MQSSATAPPLSIVVATRRPWPALRGLLDSLGDQTRAVGAEIVVADGSTGAVPDGWPEQGLRRIHEPGASVLLLRALGLAAARGDVVALTEDHCRVGPDWCRRILDSHRAFPAVAAVGGAVENAARASLVARLHFMIAYGVFMRPLRSGDARFIAGEANVSYKRWALPAAPVSVGLQQMLHNLELRGAGHRLIIDDRIVVDHDQPVSFAQACGMHFHNGRCIAGFRRTELALHERLARLASCLILPLFLTARAVVASFRKGRERAIVVAGLPILLALSTCHAAGEGLGYLCGPGDSPFRVA